MWPMAAATAWPCASSAPTGSTRTSRTRCWPTAPAGSTACSPRSGSSRASGCSACSRPPARAVRRAARHAAAPRGVLPAVLRVRPRAGPAAAGAGQPAACSSPPPSLYRRKVAPIRDQLPDLAHVLIAGPGARAHHRRRRARPAGAAGRGPRPGPGPPDRPRGLVAAALHQRHDRDSPRASSTCTRRSSRTRPPRARSSTSATATCSGARPTRAGSPARRTASSRRSPAG